MCGIEMVEVKRFLAGEAGAPMHATPASASSITDRHLRNESQHRVRAFYFDHSCRSGERGILPNNESCICSCIHWRNNTCLSPFVQNAAGTQSTAEILSRFKSSSHRRMNLIRRPSRLIPSGSAFPKSRSVSMRRSIADKHGDKCKQRWHPGRHQICPTPFPVGLSPLRRMPQVLRNMPSIFFDKTLTIQCQP